MAEIKSVSDEELSRLTADKQAFTVPVQQKPYMIFEAGEVVCESGLPGIKYDFNYGARVTVPQGEYRVKLIDRSACLTVYDAPASGVMVTSSKKYFVDFRIEVYEKDNLIFAHDLDLKGKKVLIKFPTGILGDILAWFPYAEEFRKKHQCELYCAVAEDMAELFKAGYPKNVRKDYTPATIWGYSFHARTGCISRQTSGCVVCIKTRR